MLPDSDGALRTRLVGLGFLFLTGLGWGGSWIVTKQLTAEWPVLSIRAFAGLGSILLLGALAVARGESLKVPAEVWPRLIVFAALNVGCWQSFAALSLLWLGAGEASILAYTMPVWTALLASLLLKERFTLWRALALALALTGMIVLVTGHGIDASLEKWPGMVFALGCAVAFSFGTVFLKRWPLMLPPIAGVTWQLIIGFSAVGVLALTFEDASLRALSPKDWVLLLYLAAVAFSACYVFWFAAIKRLPAMLAGIGMLLTPAIGVVAGSIFLGESLGLRELLALGLTATGVILAMRS